MSRTLVLVGAPVNANNRYKESRPLARVYFTRWRKLLMVEPVSRELVPFAKEVEQRIRDRLDNHSDEAFICPDPDPEHPHGRTIVRADDPNLLEAIRSDLYLWGVSGDEVIAGYYVLSTYSKIENRWF